MYLKRITEVAVMCIVHFHAHTHALAQIYKCCTYRSYKMNACTCNSSNTSVCCMHPTPLYDIQCLGQTCACIFGTFDILSLQRTTPRAMHQAFVERFCVSACVFMYAAQLCCTNNWCCAIKKYMHEKQKTNKIEGAACGICQWRWRQRRRRWPIVSKVAAF